MNTDSTDLHGNLFLSIDEKSSPKVNGLFGIAKGIELSQIVEDDRLAYLLKLYFHECMNACLANSNSS